MQETADKGATDDAANSGDGSRPDPRTRRPSRRSVRGRIFLSYRRDDTSGHAGRLYDDLSERFGPGQVFQDLATIDAGSDFLDAIEWGLGSCQALVAVIGREWLTATDRDGRRRLDDPCDVLRLELATALKQEILVVPVLVEGAAMPSANELPEPIRPLARRNALEISDTRWDHDLDRLVAVLGTVVRPGGRGSTVRRAAAGLVSLVTLVGTLLGAYWGVLPFFQRPVGPGLMTGDLNVAVAGFRDLQPDGQLAASPVADSLGSTVFEQLDAELRPFQEAGFVIERRAPADTEVVEGATREERAAAARRLADRINADIVVYGVVETRPSDASVAPEFYLSERRLADAEELAGQHELGDRLVTSGGLNNPVAAKLLRDELLGRVQAMSQFVIGLGYYGLDGHHAEARDHFEAALAAPGWDEDEGKEVLYLFLGNALQKAGDLSGGASAYERAVEIDPEYARGRLGVAEVMFQRAKGACEAGEVDAAGLEGAAAVFRAALEAQHQPPSSNVSIKADLGLGRVQLCQSQALLADRWQEAAASFGRVIAAYEGGNQRVRQLAAEAYAGLGLVELPVAGAADARERLERSAVAYGKAIEASRAATRTAAFYAMLAFVHDQLGELDEADAAYAEAIRLEPDPSVRARYEQARQHGTSEP